MECCKLGMDSCKIHDGNMKLELINELKVSDVSMGDIGLGHAAKKSQDLLQHPKDRLKSQPCRSGNQRTPIPDKEQYDWFKGDEGDTNLSPRDTKPKKSKSKRKNKLPISDEIPIGVDQDRIQDPAELGRPK